MNRQNNNRISIISVILDLIMIYGLDWGIEGAAIAAKQGVLWLSYSLPLQSRLYLFLETSAYPQGGETT